MIESGRPLWASGVPLFVEFDPRASSRPNDAAARPIAELADFCRAFGPMGSDALPLPAGFDQS